MNQLPEWLSAGRDETRFRAMLLPDSPYTLEQLAAESKALTLRRFGRTMSLYAPLYLSNHCSSGCAYCGFASDRKTPRRRLEQEEIRKELDAMQVEWVPVEKLAAMEEEFFEDHFHMLDHFLVLTTPP